MSTKRLNEAVGRLIAAAMLLGGAGTAGAQAQTVACCFGGGGCQDLPASQCIAFGGAPAPAGTTCANFSCQQPQACCTQSGACVGPMPPMQCAQVGGYPGGIGSTCTSNTCAERPCCLPDGTCLFASPQYCVANNGTPGPLGGQCPAVCPTPDNCGPTTDGSNCLPVTCPDATEKCQPKKVILNAAGQIKVLECGCTDPNTCHVNVVAGAPPSCTGGCPPGQICRQEISQTADGFVFTCTCEDDATQCGPTPDGLRCLNATCPVAAQKCQPKCVSWYPPTNSFQVLDCECRNPDACYVDTSGILQGIAPHCTGVCPSGFTCKETRTVQADGSETVCCECIPQAPDCGPNPNFTGCNPVTCPVPNQQCIPKKIHQTAAGGFFVSECDCDNPQSCHITMGPALPFCVGSCPNPTQICQTITAANPSGGKDYSCQCVCDPAKCDDGNPCTIDSCDPVTQTCVHMPNPDCQACCIPGAPCQNLLPGPCVAIGGIPQGAGTDCVNIICPPPPPPIYPKFSQRPTAGRDDLPSNLDPNGVHPNPNIVHADDFQSDGRPIVMVRWWGSYLNQEFVPPQFGGFGQTPYAIDGWLISFHQPIKVSATALPAPPLGLYFAPASAVAIRATTIPPCDNHAVYGYEVRLDQCCLLCANVDTRSNLVPAQCDAFREEHCFVYDIDIQAVVGRSWSGGCGQCLPVSTQNHAINVNGSYNFWGWHTSAIENGARQAIKTSLSNPNNLSCPNYGPWSYATPICTFTKRENMAFELLTSVQQVPPPCPRACCLPNGTCIDVTVATQCHGKLQPVGSSCATVACPKPPVVIKWRSVRSHPGFGLIPIVLNPTASGNGPGGPTTESRNGGIQRIEVDFDQPVLLVNPAAVTTTGRTTGWPLPVLGGPVAYSPSSIFMLSPTTMVLTYPASPTAGFLPNQTCYNFNVIGSVQNASGQGLVGDTDCNARSLVGDATSDGVVNLSDPLYIKAHWGASPLLFPQCDVTVSGVINVADSLLAKSWVVKPPRRCLCP